MKNSDAYTEIIEKFLEGKLEGEELNTFGKELAENPALLEELQAYQETTATLSHYGRRQLLRDRLSRIHQEMMAADEPGPLKVVRSGNSKIGAFILRHRASAAIAAGIAALSVIATFYSVNYFNSAGKKQQTAFYQSLKRDIDNIRSSQREMMQGINATENKPAFRYENVGGTGFAISSDGYILTSFHLLKGADSVFIENKKYSRLPVKEIFKDSLLDIAILKISSDSFPSFETLPYGFKQAAAEPGEKVYTLGYPREDIVFGEGSLSSRSGFDGDTVAYQISIPVNPGNSGGPLFDEQGNLIGVISGKNSMAEGTSFAIKAGYIMNYINEIPLEHLPSSIELPRKNSIKGLKRTEQIKKIEDYIFIVKAYNRLP